ncbi:hypothetical protein [Anaerotruncus colihominis]|uniref:hypothetical protein n=1 Tax=Anaerotruncus colihominis TaxID=169435 RepID=UPI003AB287EB
MKRFLSIFTAAFLLLTCSIPAFADWSDDSADKVFIPDVPSFVSPNGNTTVKFETANKEIQSDFIDNLSDAPYLVLLRQELTNGYYEGEYIGDDRRWWVYIVRFPTKKPASTLLGEFSYRNPRDADPMQFMPHVQGAKYILLQYDFKKDKLICNNQIYDAAQMLHFSYVIDASPLAGSIPNYPFKNTLVASAASSGKFNVLPEKFEIPVNGKDVNRYYDWWLPIRTGTMPPEITDPDPEPDPDPDINIDTDGDGEPDVNVDTDGDGKPDVDIDTDGDGKPDVDIDTNGDGKPDINIDTDGDGKPDINVDTNGDGKPDDNIDTDGDGWPDENVKPGGSGGGPGGGGGGTSGGGVDIPPKDDGWEYDGWHLFDPFDYDYTPPGSSWDDYDPLEGYDPFGSSIPWEFDIPDNNVYHNPWWVPDWAKNTGVMIHEKMETILSERLRSRMRGGLFASRLCG